MRSNNYLLSSRATAFWVSCVAIVARLFRLVCKGQTRVSVMRPRNQTLQRAGNQICPSNVVLWQRGIECAPQSALGTVAEQRFCFNSSGRVAITYLWNIFRVAMLTTHPHRSSIESHHPFGNGVAAPNSIDYGWIESLDANHNRVVGWSIGLNTNIELPSVANLVNCVLVENWAVSRNAPT